MVTMVQETERLVEIYLTHADRENPLVQAELKQVYQKYRASRYLVAVFHSGDQELYRNTAALLAYNRKQAAEQSVRQEREQRSRLRMADKPTVM